jgi:hypothetical protein
VPDAVLEEGMVKLGLALEAAGVSGPRSLS